jgi:glutamate-1-semialdehyde 2,1-aminomutase
MVLEDKLSKLQERIFSDYRAKTPKSEELFNRAKNSLAGGVSGNLRFFSPYPLYTQRSQGTRIIDVDGNAYVDYFSANGPMMLGHNHPAVVASIEDHKFQGSLPFNPSTLIDVAEKMTTLVPCAERVRFLNTGTEAVMTALRIARAFTGRSKIIKFYGHYHGQDDALLFALNHSRAIASAGIPKDANADIKVAEYNNIESVYQSLDDDIAAVILDPAMHGSGLWGREDHREFLQVLRKLTLEKGVLLIFDEVITGFRLALGGAQEFFSVTPDMATYAKAVAAGEKLAVVAGREDIMNVVDPKAPLGTPRVYQSGTMNDGNPALAAAIGALTTYQELGAHGEYQRLNDRSKILKEGLEEAFAKRGVPAQINQLGSMLVMFFSSEPVTFENRFDLKDDLLELFYLAMINEGVFLSVPTSNHIYMSFAHSDDDFEQILTTTETVLNKYEFTDVCDAK